MKYVKCCTGTFSWEMVSIFKIPKGIHTPLPKLRTYSKLCHLKEQVEEIGAV